MDRSRRRSKNRPKTPSDDQDTKSSTAKSPVRSRSKSKGRPKREGEKKSARSKSRSNKDSKSRARSKSPKPVRKRSGRSASRTRSQNKNSKNKEEKVEKLTDIVAEKQLNLVLTDVLHDDFSKETALNELIRRSVSRDISQDQTAPLRRSSRISTKKVEPIHKELSLKSLPRKSEPLIEYGGWVGGLVALIAFPLSVLTVHLACSRDQCAISKFHIPRNWKLYFNLEAAEMVIGFVLLQAILSILPIGRKVSGPPGRNGSLVYRCNGFLSAVITVAIVIGLWYYKFQVTIVYEKLTSLLVASAILGYILGFVLFIKGGRAPVPGLNPNGIIGNRLYQYVVGREVNPILFKKINVKILLTRVCLIGTVLLSGLLVLKAYEVKKEWSPTLLTALGLVTFYIIEFFWFEDSIATTFEIQYEGTGGLLTIAYMTYPFLIVQLIKFIVQHRVELPVWSLVGTVSGFLVGYVIYRASNLQKAAFRKNPLNPALAHFETIPTSRGKKLLVAGWWGWVRHPNYLGDIILTWAWYSTAGFSHALPYVYPIWTTFVLIHRAKRDDAHCSQRYQSAWDEYRSRVKYKIFPRIY